MAGPITLAEARVNLRLADDETSEDALIAGLIAAAAAHIERSYGLVCDRRAASFRFDRFARQLKIPLAPVDESSVALTYLDPVGAEQQLSADDIRVFTIDGVTRVAPAIGKCWPMVACAPGAITITANVGYPAGEGEDAPSTCPDDMKQAAHLMVGHWFTNREAVAIGTGTAPAEVPLGVGALLEGGRRRRL